MIQPYELKLDLPMEIANQVMSTTTQVWNMLVAVKKGDLEAVKKMVAVCPELMYAQYNYTPPIHFAVREGHIDLAAYLLNRGACDPDYKTYPFSDDLQTIAQDRGHHEIGYLMEQYLDHPLNDLIYRGDNGKIYYQRTDLQLEFEHAVVSEEVEKTGQILKTHPEFALDQSYFWGEGILTFAAKKNNREMADLLLHYGAIVPDILKWGPRYYFERLDGAVYMMEKGMNPNTMSWHHVTLLHNMVQQGSIEKAELLIKFGAEINPIDEEYQSTPLGMAARWGQLEMVKYLISHGADIHQSGAAWSTPLSWAIKKQHHWIEEILRRSGAKN